MRGLVYSLLLFAFTTSVFGAIRPIKSEDIYAKSVDSTVMILCYLPKGIRIGAAFFISGQGHLLTNNHIIDGCKHIEAVTKKRFIYNNPIKVAFFKKMDMAVLKVREPYNSGRYLKFSRNVPMVGSKVFVLGHSTNVPFTFQQTIITQVTDNRVVLGHRITPGASGSPILNDKGEVIGIADRFFKKGSYSLGINNRLIFSFLHAYNKNILKPKKENFRKI